MINGSILLLIVGAYGAYRVACWVHDRAEARTPNHEIESQA
jgi:hypothetical protein